MKSRRPAIDYEPMGEEKVPKVVITIRKGRDAKSKRALLDGVHNALVEAFGIPENDRFQVIHEIEPDNWDIARSDNEVMVEITAFAGRSLDAKRALYKAIVQNLKEAGVEPLDVFIIVNDLPLENWGLRGGIAGVDIDFGFKIDV